MISRAEFGRGPVSCQQEDMIRILRGIPECASRYDFVCPYELRGDLDVSCLAGALEDLVERHAILRTTLDEDGAEPRQLVHRRPLIGLELEEASGKPFELVSQLFAARLSSEQVFAGVPLFRPRLFCLGEHHYLLAVTIHHLLYDGLSMRIFWRDLSEFYDARLSRRDPDLPVLTASYLDFARWQQRDRPLIVGPAISFWREVLEGAPAEITWPRPRNSSAAEYEAVESRFTISAAGVERLRETARSLRATPFMVLLATTAIAIGRAADQDDVVLGTDFANREEPWRQEMVGHMLNTRLTRARLAPDTSLESVALEVRNAWLAGEEYRDAYIDDVLAALNRPKQTAVLLEPEESKDGPVFSGISTNWVNLEPSWHYWRELLVSWIRVAAGYEARILYRPARVNHSVVAAIGEEAQYLLGSTSRF
jgi:hypothetical protein